MAGVQAFTASSPSETATWCACEHGTEFFLTWHRMYLWYFERVLQTAAGDTSLRLPYWDYATDPALPAAYRDQTYVNEAGQTVPNPLRVEGRRPSLNAGTTGLSAAITSAAGAMTETEFGFFTDAIEFGPHGNVHCAVAVANCPTGLMGAVPAAALDPVFYAHHTNIDRLYECWLGTEGSSRLPNSQAHLDTLYTFVDSDGSTPQRRVGDMLTLGQLGYSYAAGGDCPAVTRITGAAGEVNVTNVVETDPAANEESIALAGPTTLERGTTTVPINVPQSARASLSGGTTPAPERRARIVIDGISFDQPPRTLYNVYLKGDGDRREQIGVINFFNFTAPRKSGHAEHGASAGRFSFDATSALQRLSIDASAAPALVFEPTTGLAESTPSIAADEISPQANVRFESARLVVSP
jgi:hypothetical protein